MKIELPLSQERLCKLSLDLMERLASVARNVYGEALVSLGAYGSVGRGDLHENSDVDVLLVAKKLPSGRWERYDKWDEVEKKLESEFSHLGDQGWNWSLSPVIKTPEEVQMGSPLFLDMTEDCRIIFDQDNFLRNYLSDLKRSLEDQGARRIWQGRTWYWDLQPNFDPSKKISL